MKSKLVGIVAGSLLGALLFFVSPVKASDIVWTKDNGPHAIQGSCTGQFTVNSGDKLVIEAGTVVKFGPPVTCAGWPYGSSM